MKWKNWLPNFSRTRIRRTISRGNLTSIPLASSFNKFNDSSADIESKWALPSASTFITVFHLSITKLRLRSNPPIAKSFRVFAALNVETPTRSMRIVTSSACNLLIGTQYCVYTTTQTDRALSHRDACERVSRVGEFADTFLQRNKNLP